MKYEGHGDLDYHFHTTIAKASGNPILGRLMTFISSTTKKSMMDFHHFIARNEKLIVEITSQHESIYNQLKLGDEHASCIEMEAHLNGVKNLMLESVRRESDSSTKT